MILFLNYILNDILYNNNTHLLKKDLNKFTVALTVLAGVAVEDEEDCEDEEAYVICGVAGNNESSVSTIVYLDYMTLFSILTIILLQILFLYNRFVSIYCYP